MDIIDDIKELLGNPEGIDDKLYSIVRLTESRLKLLVGADEVPQELEYIIIEVSIIRFNRIGSEGVSAHTVEGESMSFSDNDFKAFLADIEEYKAKKNAVKGVVRFL